MTLAEIPAGTTVLLDANVLIYARRRLSAEAHRLLERVVRQEIVGAITAIVLAEFCHRRMMQEAQSLGLAGLQPARELAAHPEVICRLMRYTDDVEDLLTGPLRFLTIEAEDFRMAVQLQRRHGLLTNDSLNAACALRSGISRIATADSDFERVPGLTVFRPADVVILG
jgi:predicted nucleic acid-binding protein